MMISFENPLWWLMLAAAAPLVVHLVARAKPQEHRFSSIHFLQEVAKLHVRRARPKDWLLLLLRTLACAALAAAFLLPIYGGGEEGEGGRALVIVLDNTASMGAADGQQVRMHQAVAVAENAVRSLSPRDRVNLITLAGYPQFLFDRPESARPLLLRELGRTASRPAACADVADALRAAVEQMKLLPEGVDSELLIISDFQRSEWASVPFAEIIPAEMNVRFVCAAQAQRTENTAITGLSVLPAKPLPGQEVTVTVQLQRFGGTEDLPLGVTLSAADLRLTQPCVLQADGTAEVQFQLTAPKEEAGWELRAETEADSFPGDNVRRLVVDVADKLDCCLVAQDVAHAGFVARALHSIPFLRLLQVPAYSEQSCDFLVWASPEAEDVENIRLSLENGTTVLLLADQRKETACLPLLYGKEGSVQGEVRTDGGFWTLQVAAAQDPIFRLFEGMSLDALWSAPQYARLGKEFLAPLPPSATVLLKYEDGVPALTRIPMGNGTLLLWNMPVTTRDNHWGFSPLFLPVLAETLLQSRNTPSASEPIPGRDLLELKAPREAAPAELTLRDEQGAVVETVASAARKGGSAVCRTVHPVVPGLYTWMLGEHAVARHAVNFPISESELTLADTRLLPQNPAPAAAQLEEDFLPVSERVELWPWLLLASLMFVLAELLICRVPKMKKEKRS